MASLSKPGNLHGKHLCDGCVGRQTTDFILGHGALHGQPETVRLDEVARQVHKVLKIRKGPGRDQVVLARKTFDSRMAGRIVPESQLDGGLSEKGRLLADGINRRHAKIRPENGKRDRR